MKTIKRLHFKLLMWYWRTVVERISNIHSYSVLVDMWINTEDYWKAYLQGKSIKDTISKRLKIRVNATVRHVRRKPNYEARQRLLTFYEHQINRDFIKKNFPNYKPNAQG